MAQPVVNGPACPAGGVASTVADRLPGDCSMSTGWFPAAEPTPYRVPPRPTLILLIVLTGTDRETVVHVVPDLSCKVPSSRPPPAAMSVPPAVTASAW